MRVGWEWLRPAQIPPAHAAAHLALCSSQATGHDQRTAGGLGQMGNQLGSTPTKDLKPNQARNLGCAMANHSDWHAQCRLVCSTHLSGLLRCRSRSGASACKSVKRDGGGRDPRPPRTTVLSSPLAISRISGTSASMALAILPPFCRRGSRPKPTAPPRGALGIRQPQTGDRPHRPW